MTVKPHQKTSGGGGSDSSYDIGVKVGKTIYTVLYTPPPGTYGVQYSAGYELPVLVQSKTITFNDMLGKSRKVPILSREPAPASSQN